LRLKKNAAISIKIPENHTSARAQISGDKKLSPKQIVCARKLLL